MSKSKIDKFMGLPLGDADESDSDSGTSSSSKSDAEEDAKLPKKKLALSVEDLERAGYKSGPSVLLVKPPAEQEPCNWNWSNGRTAKQQEGEDGEDRAATREAVTKAVEDSALHSIKAMQHAAKLREEVRQERLEAKQQQAAKDSKALSFNQKEKRKRDAGQSSRGKNYVEESKRQAREFGVYSGFD